MASEHYPCWRKHKQFAVDTVEFVPAASALENALLEILPRGRVGETRLTSGANTALRRSAQADATGGVPRDQGDCSGRAGECHRGRVAMDDFSRLVISERPAQALLAERDAEIALLREAGDALTAKSPCFVTIRRAATISSAVSSA